MKILITLLLLCSTARAQLLATGHPDGGPFHVTDHTGSFDMPKGSWFLYPEGVQLWLDREKLLFGDPDNLNYPCMDLGLFELKGPGKLLTEDWSPIDLPAGSVIYFPEAAREELKTGLLLYDANMKVLELEAENKGLRRQRDAYATAFWTPFILVTGIITTFVVVSQVQ